MIAAIARRETGDGLRSRALGRRLPGGVRCDGKLAPAQDLFRASRRPGRHRRSPSGSCHGRQPHEPVHEGRGGTESRTDLRGVSDKTFDELVVSIRQAGAIRRRERRPSRRFHSDQRACQRRMRLRNPPHPGEIVRTLCLEPLGVSPTSTLSAVGALGGGLNRRAEKWRA